MSTAITTKPTQPDRPTIPRRNWPIIPPTNAANPSPNVRALLALSNTPARLTPNKQQS